MNDDSIENFSILIKPYGETVDFQFYFLGELEGISELKVWSEIFYNPKVTEYFLFGSDWPVKFTLLTISINQMPHNVSESIQKAMNEILKYSSHVFALFEGAFDVTILDGDWVVENTYAIGTRNSDIYLCLKESCREGHKWKSDLRRFYGEIYKKYPSLRYI